MCFRDKMLSSSCKFWSSWKNTRSRMIHTGAGKMACEKLGNVKEFISKFDTILCDCDGVLWNSTVPVPGAAETIDKLKKLGKRIFYVTNSSARARDSYGPKFKALGFHAEKDDIISSGFSTAMYVKKHLPPGKTVYLIGTPPFSQELTEAGVKHNDINADSFGCDGFEDWELDLDPTVGCVVVGFDLQFNHRKISRAVNHLLDKNCLFVATNMDETMLLGSGKVIAGTGAMVTAVAYSAQRQPIVCGKPERPMFDLLHELYGVEPAKTLIIGDRLNTDIQFASKAGLTSLLVLTGSHKMADVEERRTRMSEEDKQQIPDFYTDSISDIGEMLDPL